MALVDVVVAPRLDTEPAPNTPNNPVSIAEVLRKTIVPQKGGYIYGYVVFDQRVSGTVKITVYFSYYDTTTSTEKASSEYVSKQLTFSSDELIEVSMLVRTPTGVQSNTYYVLPFRMLDLPDEMEALQTLFNAGYMANRIKIVAEYTSGAVTESVTKWLEYIIRADWYNIATKVLKDSNGNPMSNARIMVATWIENSPHIVIRWVEADDNGVFRIPYDVFLLAYEYSGQYGYPDVYIFGASEYYGFFVINVVHGDTKLTFNDIINTQEITLSTSTASHMVKVVVERNLRFKIIEQTASTADDLLTALVNLSNGWYQYFSQMTTRTDVAPIDDKKGRIVNIDFTNAMNITDTSAGDVGLIVQSYQGGAITVDQAINAVISALSAAITSYLKYIAEFNDPYSYVNEVWVDGEYVVEDSNHIARFYSNIEVVIVSRTPMPPLWVIILIALAAAAIILYVIWQITVVISNVWVAVIKSDTIKYKVDKYTSALGKLENVTAETAKAILRDAVAINNSVAQALQVSASDWVSAIMKYLMPIMMIGLMIFLIIGVFRGMFTGKE